MTQSLYPSCKGSPHQSNKYHKWWVICWGLLTTPHIQRPRRWGADTYRRAPSTFFESQLCIQLRRTGKEFAETACGSQASPVFSLPSFSSSFGRQPWEPHCLFSPPMTQGYEKLKKNWEKKWEARCMLLDTLLQRERLCVLLGMQLAFHIKCFKSPPGSHPSPTVTSGSSKFPVPSLINPCNKNSLSESLRARHW